MGADDRSDLSFPITPKDVSVATSFLQQLAKIGMPHVHSSHWHSKRIAMVCGEHITPTMTPWIEIW